MIVSLLQVRAVSFEVVALVFGMIKRLLGNSLLMRADLQNKKLSLRALGLKDAASQRLEALKGEDDVEMDDG